MWCTKYRKENKNDKWPNTKTNASAVQQATEKWSACKCTIYMNACK